VNVRSAEDRDRAAIAALHTLSWQQTYRKELPDELLDGRLRGIMDARWQDQPISDRDVVLVAETDDGEIVGFASTWVADDGYIDNLHVSSGWQSQGVGRALLRETARRLLDQGVSPAWLHVITSNHRARSLYLDLGGEAGLVENKNLYGTMVPNQQIIWTDVATLFDRLGAPTPPLAEIRGIQE